MLGSITNNVFQQSNTKSEKNQNGRNVANGYLIDLICENGRLQEARCQRSPEVVGEVREKILNFRSSLF